MNQPVNVLNESQMLAVKEECEDLLSRLQGAVAVVVASMDGYELASAVTRAADAERIAAMSSSITSIGSVVGQEVGIGKNESITIRSETGFVYMTCIEIDSTEAILNVVADNSAILAQVVLAASEASGKVSGR